MNIKIMSVALVALTLTSCKGDLLDMSPYDKISSASMWTTENLADKGVLGVYSEMRSDFTGLYLYNIEALAVSTTSRNTGPALVKGNCTSSQWYFSYAWQELYEGVSRANDAIANLPNAPLDAAKLGRLTAESKFLRAYFYYNLNILFRGVPLYTEPTASDDYNKARSSEADVWNQVLSDLDDCINENNLPDKYAAGDGNYGRVTKGAAYTLRAKVYMWLKEWAKAEADFRKVGDCGYSLFQGGYKNLFKEANEQCDEMIFSVQNYGQDGYGNDLSFRYGSRSTFGSCWNNYYPSTDFVDSYEMANGKEFNWDDFIPGYNEMTPNARAVFFLRDNMTASEIKMMKSKSADMDQYLPEGNEARIKAVYENRDPRLCASIITPYSTYLGANGTTDIECSLRWPYRDFINSPHDIRTDTNAYYYYLYRKFVAEGGSEIPNRSYSPIDVPIFRYADVLLGLAEALNEQGKTDEAIPYVNMVRNRAGVQALNTNEYTQVTGQDNLRTRIQNEYRWEFNGEGVTYYDELRWGTWKDKKFYDGAGLKQIWGQVTESYTYQGSYIEKWAIPATECERNTNLTQNDGWIN